MTLLDRTINIKKYKLNRPDMSLMSILAIYYVLFIFTNGINKKNYLIHVDASILITILIIKFMMLSLLLIILGCYNTFDIICYASILLLFIIMIDLLSHAFMLIIILLLFCELLFDANMLYNEQIIYQDESFKKENISIIKKNNKKIKRFLTFTIIIVILTGLFTKLIIKNEN